MAASPPFLLAGLLLIIQLLTLCHLSEYPSLAVALKVQPPQAAAHTTSCFYNSKSSNNRPAPPPTPQVARRPPLVQSTCNSTSFYDLCVAALAADPSSSTADVPGLCAIAVSAAAANASATAFTLLNVSAGATTPEADRTLLRTCATKYGNAREALLAARGSIAEEAYDYAFVHVSAAAEYPTVCRTLFRRQPQQQRYRAELAKREEGLRRLCTIALDIISLLQTQEP